MEHKRVPDPSLPVGDGSCNYAGMVDLGETVTHVETWALTDGVSAPETGADVRAM